MKTFLVVLIIVVVVLGGIGGCSYYHYGTAETLEITVKNKERIQNRDGDGSKYLVYTESEVFENTDSLPYGKFNSSDVYNKLDPGKTYTVKVYGWRIPFLSAYRNIVSVEE